MPDDPFTEVLKKLWELLEAEPDVAALVKVGNRIKLWSGNTNPEAKDPEGDLTLGDLPLIVIEPAGGIFNPIMTSTDGMAEQVYRIKMKDGNLILSAVYFPLKWAICKALASADALLGLSYVRSIVVEDGVEGRNTTGHPGWNLGIDIRVKMIWSRVFLKT